MTYENYNPGEAILHFGDNGSKFYIILRGTVEVKLPENKIMVGKKFKPNIHPISANAPLNMSIVPSLEVKKPQRQPSNNL